MDTTEKDIRNLFCSSGPLDRDEVAMLMLQLVERIQNLEQAPQRQPLTDEQIGDIAALFYAKWRGHEGFARAIEAAHGIKGEA